jgi:hypothetical protein
LPPEATSERAPHAHQPRACRTSCVPCGAPQVIISAILGSRSFLGSTARMEARSRHNDQHGPEWGTLPEAKRHQQQIQAVTRKRSYWKGLELPWLSGGVGHRLNFIPMGFGETIALAPLALFGHLKTGGAASLVKVPALAVPERGCCASSGHAWLLGVALGWRGTRGEEA